MNNNIEYLKAGDLIDEKIKLMLEKINQIKDRVNIQL